VTDCLRVLDERGAQSFEVRAEVQQRYNDELHTSMQGAGWTAGHCRSWYLDDKGRNTSRGRAGPSPSDAGPGVSTRRPK
jgi:hypothetical protein